MKIKSIFHTLDENSYPSKGNALVNKATLRHDEYGFNSFVLATGRYHPEKYSQAGKFYTAYWEYDVEHERDIEKQVGLKININITGYLSNDNEPPNNSYGGLIVQLEQTFPGYDMLYRLELQSNQQPGGVSENKEIIIKPLFPHPRELKLKLNTTCNVLLDVDPSSRADHDSSIDIMLKPFRYDPKA